MFMRFKMKKLIILLITFGCVLTGCAAKKDETDEVAAKMDEYETYYTEILNNVRVQETSEYYDVNWEMTELEDGTYRYYVFFDNPKIAMNNIIIMGVEDDIPFEEADKMMPSSGIFENPVSLIPGQVNTKEGYAKGIVISGESSQSTVDLKLLVQWRSSSNKKVTEYLLLPMSYQGTAE